MKNKLSEKFKRFGSFDELESSVDRRTVNKDVVDWRNLEKVLNTKSLILIHPSLIYGLDNDLLGAIIIQHIQKIEFDEGIPIDGEMWVKKSVKQLHEELPFISNRQIISAINRLINKGVLKKRNDLNELYDNTLSYCIDYFVLSRLKGVDDEK